MATQVMAWAGWLGARVRLLTGVAVLILAGCASQGRPLMPTPSLYQKEPGRSKLFESTVPDRRSTNVELFYVTDRAKETDQSTGRPYGEVRASSLAFGTASVEMLPGLDWPELAKQSAMSDRTRDVLLELGAVKELARFPEEPYEVRATSA